MGYCVDVRKECFYIRAGAKVAALEAIKELANHPEWMDGSSFIGGKQTSRFYSWTETNEYVNATTLEDAIQAWGWEVHINPLNNDVDGIRFNGEKSGQEDILFNALAPYVDDDCYIEMEGEDGYIWRYVFNHGDFDQIAATITFDGKE